MKLFILLAGLIAFVAAENPLSDEVSRELLFSIATLQMVNCLDFSLLKKSTKKLKHGRLDVISMKTKTSMF